MKTSRWVTLVLLTLSLASTPASASWLSDVIGININVPEGKLSLDKLPLDKPPLQQLPNDVIQLLPVAPQDAAHLIQKINQFDTASARVASIYADVSIGVVLGSILIGLAASIAGFCEASKLAGVLSIFAAAVLGVGSALPINQNADFYRLLSAQSHALLSDAELHPTMTTIDYAKFRDGLRTLILFEGERFPSRSGTQQATQELIAQLNNLSSAVKP